MNMQTVLETKDLTKVYHSGAIPVTAIDSVSLALKSHQVTLLRGPSGSGKSTLLSAISGLMKPDSGEVHALGKNIWKGMSGKRTKFRRQNCGFVFQSVGLFPALTAVEQIMAMLSYIDMPKRIAREKAIQALTDVGLADRIHHKPIEMSGGENQRVAIARMLAKDPQLIFCDEPTSALDSTSGAVVADLLKTAAHERGAMVFCVTHDDRLMPYADRILEIEDGKIKTEKLVERAA